MDHLNLYQTAIMNHYRFPSQRGIIDNPDYSVQGANPACGDMVSFTMRLKDGRVMDIRFQGNGCVLSQAAASMLSEHVLDKSISDIKHIEKQTIIELMGIALGPTRLRCALLALETLQNIC